MIGFHDLVVRYARGMAPAVNRVTFAARRGAITAVVGPNGSGKSTLVRTLLGRVTPDAGRVTIDGTPLDSLSRQDVARRCAVVVQREEPVFPLIVTDYVGLGRYAHGGAWGFGDTGRDAAVAAALRAAQAEPLAARRTDELSGGEWQRVRLARALAQGGDAVVLDEPGTFLDIAHEMAQLEMLAVLARGGHAVLLVSHQLNLVARFADEMVLLAGGAVVARGAPADVMRADVLEQVYQWPLVVTRDPAVGSPTLIPLRTPTPSVTPSPNPTPTSTTHPPR
jgi:iron complex transport system ATP-binding protein